MADDGYFRVQLTGGTAAQYALPSTESGSQVVDQSWSSVIVTAQAYYWYPHIRISTTPGLSQFDVRNAVRATFTPPRSGYYSFQATPTNPALTPAIAVNRIGNGSNRLEQGGYFLRTATPDLHLDRARVWLIGGQPYELWIGTTQNDRTTLTLQWDILTAPIEAPVTASVLPGTTYAAPGFDTLDAFPARHLPWGVSVRYVFTYNGGTSTGYTSIFQVRPALGSLPLFGLQVNGEYLYKQTNALGSSSGTISTGLSSRLVPGKRYVFDFFIPFGYSRTTHPTASTMLDLVPYRMNGVQMPRQVIGSSVMDDRFPQGGQGVGAAVYQLNDWVRYLDYGIVGEQNPASDVSITVHEVTVSDDWTRHPYAAMEDAEKPIVCMTGIQLGALSTSGTHPFFGTPVEYELQAIGGAPSGLTTGATIVTPTVVNEPTEDMPSSRQGYALNLPALNSSQTNKRAVGEFLNPHVRFLGNGGGVSWYTKFTALPSSGSVMFMQLARANPTLSDSYCRLSVDSTGQITVVADSISSSSQLIGSITLNEWHCFEIVARPTAAEPALWEVFVRLDGNDYQITDSNIPFGYPGGVTRSPLSNTWAFAVFGSIASTSGMVHRVRDIVVYDSNAYPLGGHRVERVTLDSAGEHSLFPWEWANNQDNHVELLQPSGNWDFRDAMGNPDFSGWGTNPPCFSPPNELVGPASAGAIYPPPGPLPQELIDMDCGAIAVEIEDICFLAPFYQGVGYGGWTDAAFLGSPNDVNGNPTYLPGLFGDVPYYKSFWVRGNRDTVAQELDWLYLNPLGNQMITLGHADSTWTRFEGEVTLGLGGIGWHVKPTSAEGSQPGDMWYAAGFKIYKYYVQPPTVYGARYTFTGPGGLVIVEVEPDTGVPDLGSWTSITDLPNTDPWLTSYLAPIRAMRGWGDGPWPDMRYVEYGAEDCPASYNDLWAVRYYTFFPKITSGSYFSVPNHSEHYTEIVDGVDPTKRTYFVQDTQSRAKGEPLAPPDGAKWTKETWDNAKVRMHAAPGVERADWTSGNGWGNAPSQEPFEHEWLHFELLMPEPIFGELLPQIWRYTRLV